MLPRHNNIKIMKKDSRNDEIKGKNYNVFDDSDVVVVLGQLLGEGQQT